MSFKFSTNFLLPYVRKPAKYGGRGSIGLDATPTVLIHIGHPVESANLKIKSCVHFQYNLASAVQENGQAYPRYNTVEQEHVLQPATVASSKTSHLEQHPCFYRWLMKGILYAYVLLTLIFSFEFVTCIITRNYRVYQNQKYITIEICSNLKFGPKITL